MTRSSDDELESCAYHEAMVQRVPPEQAMRDPNSDSAAVRNRTELPVVHSIHALQQMAGNRAVANLVIQRQSISSSGGIDDAFDLRPSERPIELGPQGVRSPRARSLREEY